MLLDEIGNYLQAQGVGTIGTDLYLSQMPDQPDTALSIQETGGYPPDLHADIDYPTFQIMCRSMDYQTARSKAEDAFKVLHGLAETILGTRRYLLISAMQSPTYIGRDASMREMISTNYEVILENQTNLR